MGYMSFTFTKGHHTAAHQEHTHPIHGRYNEYPALDTTPQQDVDAINQCTKIHPVTDSRAQPWCALVMANLHNYDVTTLPAPEASTNDAREFLFFALGCDRYGSIMEKKQQDTVQFIQCFPLDGKGLRKLMTKEDWLVLVPFTWTSVYKDTHDISKSTRQKIAKHCYEAVSPLIEAELKEMKEIAKKQSKTRFVQKLKAALCFGKKKGIETPPPEYVEKERFSFDY